MRGTSPTVIIMVSHSIELYPPSIHCYIVHTLPYQTLHYRIALNPTLGLQYHTRSYLNSVVTDNSETSENYLLLHYLPAPIEYSTLWHMPLSYIHSPSLF